MDFGFGTYALGFGAGVLSILSPCVLPLLPIVITSVLAEHRWGPLALALGLGLAFAAVGLFFATVGVALGLDAELLRKFAAVLMLVFGALLSFSRLRAGFEAAASRLTTAGDAALAHLSLKGWIGQFVLGLLIGGVWAPCVGPTLGAATALAAQSTRLPQVALLMVLFGIGAAVPLLVLGSVSRRMFQRLRTGLAGAGSVGRRALGALLLILGGAILTGVDRRIEAWLIQMSPQWLIDLSTRL